MSLTFAAIIFTALISVALPLAALILLRVKFKTGLLAALTGALGFFIFALVLEPLLHALVIPRIVNNAWLFVAYGCLASGLFEETSRLIGFSLMKRLNKASMPDAFCYGIGHGGIEALLLVGVNYIYFLSLLFIPNGELLLPRADTALFFIAGLERLLAMLLHLSLSLLMWLAVTQKGKMYLYPVSIALHAFGNAGSALMQAGILKSYYTPYISLILATAAAWVLFVIFNKKQDTVFI